ncbi:HAD-IC family P-type ATPase [Lactobacillus helveticus]|jgi:cation-transporting P-type ATPase E|uniref:Cation-transporting ATPase E n=2 Tax=Lactobacillus helveticus TaxID=1587 RepID=A0A9Q5BZI0_LACHE|nr:HAD-IC family P-type ATPase [Lactobacillus helveticus]ADX70413.1 P-ATPase superfamily cation transporter [Lactobacillus helveticus H10]NRN72055.1 putative cation-transporting ATPase E [Lactobacillus helveticus]NRN74025.1 putative cation-transporting ATPase E [Lactobacillus helveticus]NRN78454.1 putative cation-transporting ATPase E [Lactobacillus helveticus]NRN82754.1 putative cation-transporting ATPase E [Lactobacillus helveticus]
MNEEKTNLETGLTTAEVEQKIAAGEVNKAVDDQFKTNKQIIRENVFTYFNLIFLVLSILLVVVGAYKDLTFLPVIILNTVIGIVQEIRAKKILSKLNVMNATDIGALRNGKEEQVPIEKLVKGDIVLLKTGDQIPADGQVIKGNIRVNESLLTGESDEITKEVGDELMSGSFVVSGNAYMQLEKVGKESYISKLTIKAKAMGNSEQSEMVRSINKLIKWVGIIIIPLGIALFSMSFFVNKMSLYRSIVSMEAAIIGMIPEGLYLLTTIALALSAVRLARKQVMLHDMKSVETLARVNVLCVDKTGTITEPKMSVEKAVPSKNYQGDLDKVIGDFAQNMPADNATMKAVHSFFTQNTGQKASSILPFTSVNKYSGVVFNDHTLLIGAPEMVLRDQFDECQAEFEKYAKTGYRVLIVADYPGVLTEDDSKLTKPVEVYGYILLTNPIRKEAKATFEYFAKQGVAIKVISGDNPVTVSRVAQQAGIQNSDAYIDASEIPENGYEEAVQKYSVFGRVKPEQKRKFVKALQKQGNTVAMTGDGVNDILAMKKADCSIAMASGNSAAVQASQVVLLDSNFARMPKVVNEGRRVVNNIQRSASLFLVKNIFSFLMAIFSLVMVINYPLQPSQITLISAFTIGLPSFLLALESNHNRIRGQFIPNILSRAIPGGLTDMLAVSILVVAGGYIALDHNDVGTTATLLLVAVGMMVLYHISAPLNRFRLLVMLGSFLGLILAIIFLHDLFSLKMISDKAIFILVVLFCAATTIFRWLSRILDGIREVLVIFDQKGKNMTFGEFKEAYRRGRENKIE